MTDWGGFDRFIGIDWSGAAKASSSAIFIADGRPDGDRIQVTTLTRAASRNAVEEYLRGEADLVRHKQWEQERWPAPARLSADERVLVGLDFASGFPHAFAQHLDGRGTTPWAWAAAADEAERLDDYIKAEGGRGWFKFDKHQDLPAEAFRDTEVWTGSSPASVFNLAAGAKQVGRGSIRGMAMLHRLMLHRAVQVWPFDAIELETTGPPVLVEMYPVMWLGTQTSKSHLPVRVAAVKELRDYLNFDEDVKLAAIGDDDALDALAILAGFCRRRPPATELGKAPPEASSEGWIWGTDPVDLTVGR